ncbi:hypothetical protein METBIDRAFT_116242 [Metschnikowia bicuspidata var. bicuspidata NRRL YB-4993]|uniref:Uncharacterized protein n=1 Tax=Metschnikowia bicuspidata var. bicuspidata NRRL YB-4993 TaxID=869754 RepID=A0A1A0HJF9_9ASCO|nr:hypothetical protein METBIDRAFT_116242 [Metschnikowia bicuspidata var. bicuspidata NRRL YB-4993]OBA24022.1 hypothetical protein METBIDRAFT_116242 [Metschnikowia bicuspidata var. bicuspidata NRRL YB-4993]
MPVPISPCCPFPALASRSPLPAWSSTRPSARRRRICLGARRPGHPQKQATRRVSANPLTARHTTNEQNPAHKIQPTKSSPQNPAHKIQTNPQKQPSKSNPQNPTHTLTRNKNQKPNPKNHTRFKRRLEYPRPPGPGTT